MLQPIQETFSLCIISAKRMGCWHRGDIEQRNMEQIKPGSSFSDLLRILKCKRCKTKTPIKLYARRKPRG